MALITRVARLFRADMHAVLDRIEEPESLLRQAMREMEEALGRDEQHLKSMTGEHDRLIPRMTGLERSLGELDGELDLCFASAKEELARTLVKRKLERQRMHQLLAGKRESLEGELTGLRTRVQNERERLAGMRQKAELLAEEQAEDEPDERWHGGPDFTVRDEDVELAFLREQEKRRRPT